MTALVPDSVMANLRTLAESGLTTSIAIYSRTLTTTTSGDDYGDDNPVYSEETVRTVVKGWFHSTPTPTQTEDSGALTLVNTYRLFLPVGTVVKTGDRVVVGADEYTVSDTTSESTWQALLTCSLRKRD